VTDPHDMLLASPGPVPVPPAVLEAIARPVLHHRTDAFEAILAEARQVLADVYAASVDGVVLLSGNGTAAFEAGFLAAVPAGTKVLAAHAGKFGQRWAKLARVHGHEVTEVTAPWGETVPPSAIEEALQATPEIGAVLLVHSETSTGVLHDLEAQVAAVRRIVPDARIVVDAVTSLGVSELRPEAWQLDAVVAGSQKGVMLPPGLGFAWLSERVREQGMTPRRALAWDLHAELAAQNKGTTATTPAVRLVAGLAAVRPYLLADGIEALWARRARLNEALLAAGAALGCMPYAERPSPAVAALRVPEGISAPAVVAACAARGVQIAGGQDDAKPFLIRPALLGYAKDGDVLSVAGTLELAFQDVDATVQRGSASAAALDVLAR